MNLPFPYLTVLTVMAAGSACLCVWAMWTARAKEPSSIAESVGELRAGTWRSSFQEKLRGTGPALLFGLVLGFLALAVLGLPIPAAVLGILGILMERSLQEWRRARARASFRDALVGAVDLLGQLLPAGHGVRQALQSLAEGGPVELRGELQTVIVRMREVPLDLALLEADRRIKQPLFSLMVSALSVGARSGGRITPLLEELSRAAHQIQTAQDQIRAEQAQGRLGALVIALMPVFLIAVLRVVNPAYLQPYHGLGGQLVLSLLLALIVIGYSWMLRILRARDVDQIHLLAGSPGSDIEQQAGLSHHVVPGAAR